MPDVVLETANGGHVALSTELVAGLRARLRGAVRLPGEPGYESCRTIWNAMIDRRPGLIVCPAGAADVIETVRLAREHGLLLAVKGAGHNIAGLAVRDRALMLDLSGMKSVRIDPAARTARVEPGVTLGEFDREAQAFGLATPLGINSTTGVAGLTLGGGFGWLSRKHGLTVDNLISADVVTADGTLVHASAKEHPDLFWAIRGGGGNFGVVTSFEFRLHPMQRQVIGGDAVFPISRARELLDFYSTFSLEAPDDLYCDAVMHSPAGGKDGAFIISVCYSGPAGDADRVLAPLRKLGKPLNDSIASVDYVKLQRSSDITDPRNRGEYLKSGFINGFPPELVATLVDGFQPDPQRGTVVFFQHSGGAIGRVAPDATAFPHRRSRLNMFAVVTWDIERDGAPHVKYVKDYWSKLQPHTDGYYTNEVANEPQRQVDENYQGNIGRLVEVKNKYDPGNLFRLNANVKPTA